MTNEPKWPVRADGTNKTIGEMSETEKRPLIKRAIRRTSRNADAQARYDAEWGTDNGFSAWDNMPSAGDY